MLKATRSLLAFTAPALIIIAGQAQAELINPSWLSNSIDGPSTTVAARLAAAGFSSSVGLVNVHFGDQTEAEVFEMNNPASPMNWSVAWQAAGFGPFHRLGYYQAVSEDSLTPGPISWAIGGASSGLPAAINFSIEGIFGLAFYSGANRGVNSPIYYSQTSLNAPTTGRDHLVTLNMLSDSSILEQPGVIATWEDAFHIDHDYNDFGLTLEGARPAQVPTPSAPLALLAAASFAGRRRRLQR